MFSSEAAAVVPDYNISALLQRIVFLNRGDVLTNLISHGLDLSSSTYPKSPSLRARNPALGHYRCDSTLALQAARHGKPSVLRAMWKYNPALRTKEVANKLLSHLINAFGNVPEQWLDLPGKYEMLDLLLDEGADLRICAYILESDCCWPNDENGEWGAHWCATFECFDELMRFLLERLGPDTVVYFEKFILDRRRRGDREYMRNFMPSDELSPEAVIGHKFVYDPK